MNPVGSCSFLGIGLEGSAGYPVLSQVEIPFTSESLEGKGEPIRSKAVHRIRSTRRAVMGAYAASGEIAFEVTPSRISKIIYAILSDLTTAGNGPYSHTFTTGSGILPTTVQVGKASRFHIYPGCYPSALKLRAAIDEIVTGTLSVLSMASEIILDAEASDPAMAAGPDTPFVFYDGLVTVAGEQTTDTNNWEINIATGAQATAAVRRRRNPSRVFGGEALVTGSFEMLFSSAGEHKRWMGYAAPEFPLRITRNLVTFPASLVFLNAAGECLSIDLPKIYYSASGAPIEGRQGIVQRLRFAALLDEAAASDVVVTLTNAETNASITAVGTEISGLGPAAPSGLQAIASGHDRIALTWNNPPGADPSDTVEVWRRQGAGAWSRVDSLTVGDGGARLAAGLAEGTQYSFKLRIVDGDGDISSFSGEAAATTYLEKPSALGIAVVDATTLRLSWLNPGTAQSTDAIEIYRAVGAGQFALLETRYVSDGEQRDVAGLEPETHYRFKLRRAAGGITSLYTAEVAEDTPALPWVDVFAEDFNALPDGLLPTPPWQYGNIDGPDLTTTAVQDHAATSIPGGMLSAGIYMPVMRETGSADMHVQANVWIDDGAPDDPFSEGAMLCVRLTDVESFLAVRAEWDRAASDVRIDLIKREAGQDTVLAGPYSVAHLNGQLLAARVEGTTLTAYLDGVCILTANNVQFNQQATKMGICGTTPADDTGGGEDQ